MPSSSPKFAVAAPFRSTCDDPARVLARHGLLRGYFLGTQRGTKGIPGELTYLNSLFGYWMMGTRRLFSTYRAEWFRAAAHPLYDRWVRSNLKPGDHVISSYGFANCCFEWAKRHGGKTFIDGGNSHPAQFWEVVSEEHARWGIKLPPYPPHWNKRARKMMELTDYVLSPSSYVTESFTSRGFSTDHILYLPYVTNLSVFKPSEKKDGELEAGKGPLRVICTGSVSLRKGFPYLLEAMRLVRKDREAVLMLTDLVENSMKSILPRYGDVPIEWGPSLSHDKLAERLCSAHVFALLSLEDGFARTAAEALACGLPAVISTHTGARDLIRPGVNGEVVPIRDPQAAATAILRCHDRLRTHGPPSMEGLREQLTFETFEKRFLEHLKSIGILHDGNDQDLA